MLDLKNVIKTISIKDKNYPKLLKEIKDVPEVLYYRGEIWAEENCFAVVGTRRCSAYGKQVALEIAGDLAETGLTIVSGLAPGIDTFAHLAVVERGKRTIAVLGTGIDEKSIYPQENLKLARKILELGGSLVSEYPPGTHGGIIILRLPMERCVEEINEVIREFFQEITEEKIKGAIIIIEEGKYRIRR